MFKKKNDYKNIERKSSHKNLIVLYILLFAFLSYGIFYYLQNNRNVKQAVLGVSETVDDVEFSQNINLQNSMKVLMTEPSIQSKSSYTEAIATELDDKSGFRGRIAVVNQEN